MYNKLHTDLSLQYVGEKRGTLHQVFFLHKTFFTTVNVSGNDIE